jgi:hypothetical protein
MGGGPYTRLVGHSLTIRIHYQLSRVELDTLTSAKGAIKVVCEVAP